MIKSFSHKGLKEFFYHDNKKKISAKHAKKLALILDLLDAAYDISDMSFPGSHLHLLEPKNAKRWAVNVSGNWRITFIFANGNAYKVDYIDYH